MNHRNRGKAYFENDEFAKAIEEFQKCINIVPDSAPDHINLGITLIRAKRYEEAIKEFEEARRIDPSYLHIYYGLGIIHKRQGHFSLAAEQLEKVKERDDKSVSARYNLGYVYQNLGEHEKALEEFREVVKMNPEHSTAHYHLSMYARNNGNKEEFERELQIFRRLQKSIPQSQRTPEALEKGKYSDIIEISPRIQFLPQIESIGKIGFVDVTSTASLKKMVWEESPKKPLRTTINASEYNLEFAKEYLVPQLGSAVTSGDYDNDGRLDIYVVSCHYDRKYSANILYHNNGDGTFTDVTLEAGVEDRGMGIDAIFGDYDNDGYLDLYVVNFGQNTLYHNNGNNSFTDVTSQAGVGDAQFGKKAIFVDYDHDGDLDIYVVNYCNLDTAPPKGVFSFPADFSGQSNVLYRNNGDGSFTDVTEMAGLSGGTSASRDVFFSDFDDDNDIDIYVVNEDSPNVLFKNLRGGEFEKGGSFNEVVGEACLSGREDDFNNDGYMDIFLVTRDECAIYQNDGQANFKKIQLPELTSVMEGSSGSAEILDFNNDGLIDILLVGTDRKSLHIFAHIGNGKFRDVSSSLDVDEKKWTSIVSLSSGDYDRDGDIDIFALTESGHLLLLNNQGGNANSWVEIRAKGIESNKKGTGAKVEIKAGRFYQRKTLGSHPVHFGLGDIKKLDVIRITWPNGVAQNVVSLPANQEVEITEKVQVSASCAFLYTYNGDRFVFVNEILGTGPLGVPITEGVYHVPDFDEFTKIENHQLKEKNGLYDIRIADELREIAFVDQIKLLVVDHPSKVDIYPNEMFTAPPFPEHKIHVVKVPKLPVSAYDSQGNNVLPLLQKRDGTYPTFKCSSYEGVAETHWLTLDLGNLSQAQHIMLYLTGWIYWANSSVAIAISQNNQIEPLCAYLQVKDQKGNWVTVLDSIGLPTSKGATVPINLTGKFLTDDYQVRIVTNLCLYWDEIFFTSDDEFGPLEVTELFPAKADLHFRGYSELTRDSLGFEEFDYYKVQSKGSFNQHKGRYTRYGDVLELLMTPDDKYVIMGTGDELTIQFDATKVPSLREGWSRDFLFYANGWVKDGDLNTKHSLTVEPLPFHGMSGYPYKSDESYPYDAAHISYIEKYNTRKDTDTVGRLNK